MVTQKKYRTRGSSADLHLKCSGPIGWVGPTYDDATEEATAGTAVHEALAGLPAGLDIDPADVAEKHGADPELVSAAYYNGRKIYRILEPHLVFPSAECRLFGHTTKGTADLIDATAGGETMLVADYKMGMTGDEHPAQLRAYALAALDYYGPPKSKMVTLVEIHLMQKNYIVSVVTLDQLEQFRAKLQQQHALAGKQFSAGPWCKFCPRRIDCPTRDNYIRAAGRAIDKATQSQDVTRETLGRLWDRSKVLERALAEYRKAVRIEVEKAGPIALGDGRQVTIETEEQMYFPDVASVVGSLGLSINSVCKISKTAIAKAIKDDAPNGQGAKRWRQALEHLETLGLVEKKPIEKLKVTKA